MKTVIIKGRKRFVKNLFSVSEKIILWGISGGFIASLLSNFF